MSRLDQIRRMSDDDLILFIGKYINIIGIEEI